MLTILSSQTDCSGETIANTAYTNDGPIFDGSSLCQYYTGDATDVGDIYENIDTAVQGGGACGDADIVAWETSSESGFFTFRYRARTSWNSADIMGDSCSGTSLGVHMDLDADTTAESPQKFDFYFFFSPDVTWQSTGAWRDIAGEGEVTVREDSTASGGTADDWGDATHRISDRGGTAGDGYSSISISAGDVWGRIVDIGGGFEVIEVAVAYSLIGSPSTISSRPWLLQTSTISGDIQPWHDHNDLSDLDGERLDNTCGADPTTCVSTGATPVTLSYFHAESRGREVAFEWATATETGNLGFRLYEETPMGLKLRLGDKLIPSRVIDSDGPQEYSSVAVTNSSTFYLADLDTQGIERRRGPFKLGETYGTRPTADPIDWSAVHRSRGGTGSSAGREG